MKSLSSEAKKTNVPTRSSGTSARFSMRSSMFVCMRSAEMFFSFAPLSVKPGAIALTRMPKLPQLAGERARKAHHAPLGGRVVDVVRDALPESARGDVDYLAFAPRLHGREHGPGAQEEPAEVDRHDAVPLLDGNLHERAPREGAVDGRVVDEHVD